MGVVSAQKEVLRFVGMGTVQRIYYEEWLC
jgi:hypothetical protein